MNQLSDFLAADAVLVGLRAPDKDRLVRILAKEAAVRSAVPEEIVLRALADRERLGSTGLGGGFALPHARIPRLPRLRGLFVRLARPVQFEAVDGQPVDLIFVLLIPEACGDHVSALAAIARDARAPGRLDQLRQAKGAQAIYQALTGSQIDRSQP